MHAFVRAGDAPRAWLCVGSPRLVAKGESAIGDRIQSSATGRFTRRNYKTDDPGGRERTVMMGLTTATSASPKRGGPMVAPKAEVGWTTQSPAPPSSKQSCDLFRVRSAYEKPATRKHKALAHAHARVTLLFCGTPDHQPVRCPPAPEEITWQRRPRVYNPYAYVALLGIPSREGYLDSSLLPCIRPFYPWKLHR